jgi:hypothetical protein
MKKQTVYVPIKVEDELPNKEVCGISKENELLVGYIRSTKHSHTGYEISNDDTNMTSVDRWLKPQEGYFFTEEQLNELLSNVIKDTLETAAEEAEIEQKGYFEATTEECLNGIEIYDDNVSDRPSFIAFINKQSILNTFEQTYLKHKV